MDVYVSSLLSSDGEKVAFCNLSKAQKVEVFKCTASIPQIRNEQIRIYFNFAVFCWKNILEDTPRENPITIKGYILNQCELHFGGNKSTWGSTNVASLLQVC